VLRMGSFGVQTHVPPAVPHIDCVTHFVSQTKVLWHEALPDIVRMRMCEACARESARRVLHCELQYRVHAMSTMSAALAMQTSSYCWIPPMTRDTMLV
jgi:hypothetical protein